MERFEPASSPRTVPGFPPERCAMYLEGTEGSPPRPLLLDFLGAVESDGRRALDLGCGPGREVIALLEAGFSVVALDPYPVMLERTRELLSRHAALDPRRVELVESTLEEWSDRLEPGQFDLVHAGFVLPFVRPAAFELSFARLAGAIARGGVLVAQFFGPDDEFIRAAEEGTMTCHGSDDIDRLLAGFEILHREEVNRGGNVGRGRAKWWHVHHVVARRSLG